MIPDREHLFWKSTKSVHELPEWVFTQNQNRCSRLTRIRNWDGWLEFMRIDGWRRFGLYVWDQGPGMPGDWAGRLAPAFEMIFHFNKQKRKPNKIVPCEGAGEVSHR